jgi:putative transposase
MRQVYTYSHECSSLRQERGGGVFAEGPRGLVPEISPSRPDAAFDERLKQVLAEVAEDHSMTIHALDVMPDHVHVFVEANPTMGSAEIVNRLKGRSSRVLRQEFPALRSKLPTLWSRSYFAATVGAISEQTIHRYIAEQKSK